MQNDNIISSLLLTLNDQEKLQTKLNVFQTEVKLMKS